MKHLGALIVTLAGVVMLTGVVSLGLLALVPGCTAQLCIDNEAGAWAFVDGRWVHCESWVAACDRERSRLAGVGDAAVGGGACAATARSFGCKP